MSALEIMKINDLQKMKKHGYLSDEQVTKLKKEIKENQKKLEKQKEKEELLELERLLQEVEMESGNSVSASSSKTKKKKKKGKENPAVINDIQSEEVQATF